MRILNRWRWILYITGFLVLGLWAFLYWPGHDYVRRALWHRLPKIDQYHIFEHHRVKAGNPQVWPYEPGVSSRRLPQEVEQDFQRYQTTAFLVIEEGKIIFEQYWDGYQDCTRSNSFSMAKSVISLLVGCAIDDGYISSVEQAVSDFVPGNWAWEGRSIRLKDLLTMSAGWKWDESASSLFSPTTQIYYGGDLAQIIQEVKLKEPPGVFFEYQSGVTQLLAFILKQATGKSLADYASEKLWTPIGAEEDAWWSVDEQGEEKAYCCFNAQARDFARLGQLVLQHGRWDSVQLIDSAYIASATKPASYLKYIPKGREGSDTLACDFYGYQFWILKYQGLTIPYFRGILGQYIFVVPGRNRVIVRLGRQRDSEYDRVQDYPLDINLWLKAGLSNSF